MSNLFSEICNIKNKNHESRKNPFAKTIDE